MEVVERHDRPVAGVDRAGMELAHPVERAEVRDEIAQETAATDSKKQLFEAIEEIEAARDTGAALGDAARKIVAEVKVAA